MGKENSWVIGLLSIVMTVTVALMMKTGSWLKAKRRTEDKGIDHKDPPG